eukprot:TRINITY_DN26436_c0_g1_i1.p1 TRINITY_DN26436_c0_g1~~TRINITY_DN26436_c0_g1_i1.p1  ORF type:complete len:824 (+),score=131.06 TRINITY_DN26436_c0_g1_i1:66-2474(+)
MASDICGVFSFALFFSMISAAVTVLLTSGFTHCGATVYRWLDDPLRTHPTMRERLGPFEFSTVLQKVSFILAVCVLFTGYVCDIWRWRGNCGSCLRICVVILGGSFFLVSAVFLTPVMPIIPLVLCVVFFSGAMYVLGKTILKHSSALDWSYGVSSASLVTSVVLILLWFAWTFSMDGFDGEGSSAWSTDVSTQLQGETGLAPHTSMVIWCSPAVLSAFFLLVSVFSWLRGRFARDNPKANKLTPEDVKQGRANLQIRFGVELQICLAILVLLALVTWIAASVAAKDPEIQNEALRINGVIFLGVILYITKWIGIKRLLIMAETNATLQMVVGIVTSDYAKSITVLVVIPVLPFMFFIDMFRQAQRKCWSRCGLLDRPSPGCFTEEMGAVFKHVGTWEQTSVMTKAILCAIGFFALKLFVSLIMVMFLAWLNEKMEAWTLWACLVLLFVVEMALFLFPPVAGQPLYMIAAIVIVPKFGYFGRDFFWGVVVSIVFCYVLKLLAVAVEQKAIGANFSRSVAIKKFIGVHTTFMKSIRSILSTSGFSVAKVTVLVCGPDWPTSVITGILGLPLLPMLLGSLPVVFLIAPCCVSAAFMLKAGQDIENASQHTAVANMTLIAGALLPAVGNMLLVYFVQKIMGEHSATAEGSDWMVDEQEAEVLERVQEDQHNELMAAARTRWSILPCFIRTLLVIGVLLGSASLYLLVNPVSKAFDDFAITDSIADLEGGPLSVVNPLGWVVVGLELAVCFCFAGFKFWSCVASDSDVESSSECSSDEDDSFQEGFSANYPRGKISNGYEYSSVIN